MCRTATSGGWNGRTRPSTPEDQRWISEAEVAEIGFTAFISHPKKRQIPCRLVVRRVQRLNPAAKKGQDQLFTMWRHHGFVTNSTIDKIRTLGNRAVLWDNAPKGIQDVVNGDTAMTWAYAPSALTALKNKQPIQVSAPRGTAVATGKATGFKAGPNGPANGAAFLAWWFKTANQVKYTAATGYGIVVPSKKRCSAS